MLLLFNYAFGGALEAGIGGGAYIDYIAPGIILVGATAGSVATAVAVCVDMTEGIVNRFRTMAISRGSILTGHVIGSVIQTHGQHRDRDRRRAGDRVPADGERARLAGRDRAARRS